MTKTLFAFLLVVLLSTPAANPATLPLSPYPNRIEFGPGVFHVETRVSIDVTSNAEEDRFAASLLSADLNSLDGVVTSKVKGSSRIVLARADSAVGRQILQQSGLQFPPQADEEGYVLVVNSHEASVVSKTAAGIF